jgi:hypothetical protein
VKSLTIEVLDNHSELLVGWKCLSAIACPNHGMAIVVLVQPEVHAKITTGTLPQPERHTLLDCFVQRFQALVQRIFGAVVVVASATPLTPSAPSMPPKPPGTKPQEN